MKIKDLIKDFNQIGFDLVDTHFPKKDCAERGQAIVLYAELILKIGEIEVPQIAQHLKTIDTLIRKNKELKAQLLIDIVKKYEV